MTIRLLAKHGKYDANNIVTLDAATEAGLIAAKLATSDLTGGTVYTAPAPVLNGKSPLLAPMLARAERSRMLMACMSAQLSVYSNIPSRTWQMIREVSLPFDGVRVILMHGDPAALANIKACAASGPDYADKVGNALAWSDGTFAGSATGTLAAGTVARPGLTVSDVIPVTSVARTDGGSGYLCYVRLYTPSAGTAPMSLHQQGDYTQWNNLPLECAYSSYSAGDSVTTKTGFTPSASQQSSPIWGLEFLIQGNVVSTLLVGDSTFAAFGNTNVPFGMNFGEYAARAHTLTDGMTAFTSANAGFQAQTSAQYIERFADLLNFVKPTAAVYEVFTPNDYAATANGITDALITAALARTQRFLDLCRVNNVVPILTTGIPAATAKGWTASTDAKRLALNELLRTKYVKLALIADLDAAVTDGLAPANIRPELRVDMLHPNSLGYQAEAQVFGPNIFSPIRAAFV